MFEWLRRFWRRHRGKLLFTGALGLALYAVKKYLEWKLREMEAVAIAQQRNRARRQQHFEKSQETCNTTVIALLPMLRESFLEHLRIDSLLVQIKSSKRENKENTAGQGGAETPSKEDGKERSPLAAWEKLKIASFAQYVAVVYALALLVVFLRLQANLVAGYIFLDVSSEDGARPPVVSAELHHAYTSYIRHFITHGAKELMDQVERATARVMEGVSLKDDMTPEGLVAVVNAIRDHVEAEPIFHELLFPREGSAGAESDPSLALLLDETRDVLDTALFQDTLASTVDQSFQTLNHRLISDLFAEHEAVKLARVVPVVTAFSKEALLPSIDSPLLEDAMNADAVHEFARTVFESFSNPSHAPSLRHK